MGYSMPKIFTHRNTGEKLRIKKIHGSVLTCESEMEIVITERPYLSTNIVICDINSLQPLIKATDINQLKT